MRSVDNVIWGRYYKSITDNYSKLSKVQTQISTGKKITKASDAPADTLSVMKIQAQVDNIERQNKRMNVAWNVLEHTSSTYSNIEEILMDIDSLCSNAVSSLTNEDNRQAFMIQIDQLAQELASEASSKYNGQPLIGNYIATYDGDAKWPDYQKTSESNRTNIYIDEDSQISIIPTENIEKTLNILSELCRKLDEGDLDDANLLYGEFKDEYGYVIEQNGILGLKSQIMTNMYERNLDKKTNLDIQRTDLEEIDLAAASIELAKAEQSYQLAMTVSNQLQEVLNPLGYSS